MMSKFVELILTCGNQKEAEKIADSLLAQKLVACVKFTEVKSQFRWKGEVETTNEIKLSMTTIADHFDKIESEIAKLHSYETFVLQQIPVTRINQAAADWLAGSTQ
ncbi:hypothetical protein BH09PAT4_BH09PAT4_02310 [soil metagenome]